MYFVSFLLLFPVLTAVLLFFAKGYLAKKIIVITSSVVISGMALIFATMNFFTLSNRFYIKDAEFVNILFLIIEFVIMCYLIYLGIRFKKYYVSLLSLVQSGILFWLELSGQAKTEHSFNIYIDKFAIIMCSIIAVIGCLICVYAVGYMKSYHQHHKEYKDRTTLFFPLLFLFISAMFGIVFSDNLIWLFFFWEITTFCSFLLIGYTKTKEAVTNSFRALWMNLIGGLCFAVAIAYCALKLHTLSLHTIVHMGAGAQAVTIPVFLLCIACLTKSAQLPFSKWLLGAMVAPTPTSALLHSATMVKAGAYLLIRLSPLLAHTVAGALVTTIGGFTFLATSLLAISQSDGKKVLAYSTIANLGLIIACAGIGMYEAVWAAMLLILFHAVSKSLMFLSVGAVENSIGSRNIEDMHGLIVKVPALAFVMLIGIAGMFLAPFGMLISKWAALKAFIDSNSILLIIFLVYGSAATLFYWTKWLSKLVAGVHHSERKDNQAKGCEWFSLLAHSGIMIFLCLSFPTISRHLIEPFLSEIFGYKISSIIGDGNIQIMTFMLCMIFILPFGIRVLTLDKTSKQKSSYMCGINTGDDRKFVDSLGEKKKMYLSNWYMEDLFGEKKILLPSIIIATVIIVVLLVIGIGGAL
ncbi:MAG: echA [Oscillospiraceae bacterium]|nr:echA [Oscillospiraceae bacterium]